VYNLMGEDMVDRVGTEIAGYRIESLIARGGMGEVYLATQTFPERKVALKFLPHDVASDAAFRARFIRESNAAASLEHPSIVPVYGAGEFDGDLWIAMRFVDGEDLRSLLEREGRLSPERSVGICGQVADALDEAHEHGLVHRDIKPGNILISRGDRAYLTDFGLIRRSELDSDLTKTGQFMGTVDYVAPEQIKGEPVDGRTDVYSLGCVLYECLAGEPPFRRNTEVATLYAQLADPPPRASSRNPFVSLPLNVVIWTALAKKPKDRYPTAREFNTALRRAVVVGPTKRRMTIAARRRIAIAVGAGATVLIALVAAWVLARDSTDSSGQIPLNSAVAIDPESLVIASTTRNLPTPACNLPQLEAGEGSVWWLAAPRLGRIDQETGDQRRPILVGGSCTTKSLAVGLRTVWLGDAQGLVPINPANGRALRPIELLGPQTIPGGAKDVLFFTNAVATGADAVWATSDVQRLVRVDPTTRKVGIVPIEGATDAVTYGEGAVWVLDRLENAITKIDPETNSVVGRIELSGSVDAIAVGEGAAWILDSTAGTVTPLDLTTLESTSGAIRVGVHPTDISIGLGFVWVANEGDATVSRIDPQTRLVTTVNVGRPVVSVVADEDTGAVWAAVASPNPRA
jgi:serine/threonine protein kinase